MTAKKLRSVSSRARRLVRARVRCLSATDQTGALLVREPAEELGVVLIGQLPGDGHEFPARGSQDKNFCPSVRHLHEFVLLFPRVAAGALLLFGDATRQCRRQRVHTVAVHDEF